MDDKPSFEGVFEAYEGLCRYEADRHWHAFAQIHELDDLVQEGYIGLWQAWEKCNNWQTFPKYAHMKIRDSIQNYCHSNNHLIRVPTADKRFGREYYPYAIKSLNSTPKNNKSNSTSANVTVADMIPAPEEDLALRVDVADTLAQMPQQQARNLWAVCADEWGTKEYADHVGQHVNTVKMSVKRGKERFRKAWEGRPRSQLDLNACAIHTPSAAKRRGLGA